MPGPRRDVASALDRLGGGSNRQWRLRRWSVALNCCFAVCLATLSYYVVALTDESATPAFLRHPLLMSMGTVCLVLAVASYSCKCVTRAAGRRLHTLFATLGATFMLAGVVAIVANKITIGHTPIPSSPHALLGSATILAVLMQASSGVRKWLRLPGQRVFKWHGLTGLLVVLLIAASYGLGVAKAAAEPYGTWLGVAAGVLGLTSVLSHCLQKGNSDGAGPVYQAVPTSSGAGGGRQGKKPRRDSHGLAMV